jgi:hypothetical protein
MVVCDSGVVFGVAEILQAVLLSQEELYVCMNESKKVQPRSRVHLIDPAQLRRPAASLLS